MTDRRIDVVVGVIARHLTNHTHPLLTVAIAKDVLAALDADATTRSYIGTIPPERDFSDYRDRCGEVEEPRVTLEQAVAGVKATRHLGLDEFHKDTSHNTEA